MPAGVDATLHLIPQNQPAGGLNFMTIQNIEKHKDPLALKSLKPGETAWTDVIQGIAQKAQYRE